MKCLFSECRVLLSKDLKSCRDVFSRVVGFVKKKAHLVNWDVVCSEKRQGGLGLRKLTLLNKGLLGKWIWRFASDKDCTWKNLINTKYGLEGLGCTPRTPGGPLG